jgi:hypothetical protein
MSRERSKVGQDKPSLISTNVLDLSSLSHKSTFRSLSQDLLRVNCNKFGEVTIQLKLYFVGNLRQSTAITQDAIFRNEIFYKGGNKLILN